MVKVIAVYSPSGDPAAFEKHYRHTHMPLAMKLPGLRRCEVGWVKHALGGDPRYFLVGELYFDDAAALQRALTSPEGQATAADVADFAGSLAHVMVAEVETYPAPQ